MVVIEEKGKWVTEEGRGEGERKTGWFDWLFSPPVGQY